MRLNKRYLRNIGSNIIFYIAGSLLTMLSVMAFGLLYTSGTSIKSYVSNIFKEQVVEDANFRTFSPIEEEEIKILEEKYNVLIEQQILANISNTVVCDENDNILSNQGEDTTTRLFKKNYKVDKYLITKGQDVSNNDEIIITEGYAKRHNVEFGNYVKLNNKKFKIVGYFIRPDYLNCLEETTDTYANYNTFLLAYTTDEAFNDVTKDTTGNTAKSEGYAIKYNVDPNKENTNIDELRDELFTTYITVNYVTVTSSPRISVFYSRPNQLIAFAFLFLAIIPICTVAIIAIVLNIKVKNDEKILGTIRALGYRKKEICMHYSILSMIPGIVGGLLMTIIMYSFNNNFGSLSLADFEPLNINFVLKWYIALIGIIVPTLIYVIATFITVNKLINREVTLLLRGAGHASKSSNIFIHKRSKVSVKYAFRSLFINKGRSFVIFLGIFLSTMIITLSFMMFDTIDAIVDTAMAKVGDFNYEYTLKLPEIEEGDHDGTNHIFATVYEANDRTIPVMGASSDDIDLWSNNLIGGGVCDFSSNDHYYMTSLCAELMGGVKQGDTVTIYNNFSHESEEIKITGIIDNGLLSYIMTTKVNVLKSFSKVLSKLVTAMGLNEVETKEIVDSLNDIDNNPSAIEFANTVYNIVLAKEKQQISSDNILMMYDKSTIYEQKNARMREREPIINTALIIGILICIVSIFVVVNVIIEDNTPNISMLKVLGYKNMEINNMLIAGNHFIVPIGILAGIPVGYLILNLYFKATVKTHGLIMPVTISFKTILIVLALVLGSYILTLAVLMQKAKRVKMTDSLKDNR